MSDVVENSASATPTRRQIARWRRYLANERAEAAVYRDLAHRRSGEERDILLRLAESESRHEEYWRSRLGEYVGMPRRPSLSTQLLGFMARTFGSVFALALMQSAESRTPYSDDEDAPAQIAADEQLHAEVVRALATSGREKMSGGFRAAVFGANDGLVSNVALVLGVIGSGMTSESVLITGISGLLAGALSMAAGEFISVRSQRELLEASAPAKSASSFVGVVDVDANELALVYRARGMDAEEAEAQARATFANAEREADASSLGETGAGAKVIGDGGAAVTAATSSFFAFAIGAVIPIIPFIFGLESVPGAIVALILVSIALLFTGGVTGLLSGKPPAPRALRQWAIGIGAALVTYGLGSAFGAAIG